MADKKPKQKALTSSDIIAGLKTGRRYLHRYTLEDGQIEGVESLSSIGPDFAQARHINQITAGVMPGGDPEQSIVEIDDGLVDLIGPAKDWKEF